VTGHLPKCPRPQTGPCNCELILDVEVEPLRLVLAEAIKRAQADDQFARGVEMTLRWAFEGGPSPFKEVE
jgi:hypothetical protein